MPPKAAAGKGKGGAKGPSNELLYEEQRLSDEIVSLTLRLAALKAAFVDRMEATAKSQKEKLGKQADLTKEEDKLKEKKEEKVDILADFVRQHKTDEREAIAKITDLDASVNRLLEEKIRLQKETDETEKIFDGKIKERKQQFEALCQREAEMEREFAVILGDVEDSVEKS